MDDKINIKIHTFQAYDGDCFLVTVYEPNKEVNLLIDCGSSETYHNYIKSYLLDMSKQRRKIDYLILSHIHSDHIGGAIPLLLDNGSADDPQIIEISNVIYNGFLGLNLEVYEKKGCTVQEKRIYQGIISQGQAVLGKNVTEKQITLNEELCISQLLIQGNYNWNAWNESELNVVIADSQMKIDIGNQSYIQFISPNREQLRRMNKKWELYVKRIYNRFPNIDNLHIRNAFEAFQWIINNVDYENVQEMVSTNVLTKEKIERMATSRYSYDYTDENLESIAFVLVCGKKKMLFLSDANIEVCRKNLEQIYGNTPLKINLIKLSHHGSKRNISMRFLKQYYSDSYLISAGENKLRPSMETIAMILMNDYEQKKKIYIVNRNQTIECFDKEKIHSDFNFEFIDAKDKVIEI